MSDGREGTRGQPDPWADDGQPALTRSAGPEWGHISERDFRAFSDLIYKLSGIHLTPQKKVLLVGRLNKRLRSLGLASFAEYYRYVQEGPDPNEVVRMLDCICTTETHFFRESQQFEFLEKEACPRWAALASKGLRPRHLKVWSAACSTGEEPYSLAMCLLTKLPPDSGWAIDILATDLSTKALSTAVEGIWPIDKAGEIPEPHLSRFMLRGTGASEGTMAAGAALRSVIRFQRLNLAGDRYPAERGFDLILCRNVLIYFDRATKTRVLNRLLGHLATPGYLFLGHAETLHGVTPGVKHHAPSIYSLSEDQPAKGPAHGDGP